MKCCPISHSMWQCVLLQKIWIVHKKTIIKNNIYCKASTYCIVYTRTVYNLLYTNMTKWEMLFLFTLPKHWAWSYCNKTWAKQVLISCVFPLIEDFGISCNYVLTTILFWHIHPAPLCFTWDNSRKRNSILTVFIDRIHLKITVTVYKWLTDTVLLVVVLSKLLWCWLESGSL